MLLAYSRDYSRSERIFFGSWGVCLYVGFMYAASLLLQDPTLQDGDVLEPLKESLENVTT